MKNIVKVLGTGLLIWTMGTSYVVAAEAGKTPSKTQKATGSDAATLKMVYAAMRSRVFIQTIAKDYLYIGNDVATTKAKKEMAASWKKYDAQQKQLANAFSDAKMKNLIAFVAMNTDEIRTTLKQPYSLDNAQVIIDLAEAISEGSKKMAASLRKKLTRDYPTGKGQRYLIIQIAKYYMAYQAGIKDDNTIKQMSKVVARFDTLLAEMKAYPRNTVPMSQLLNKTDKLWKIVKQFYLDIEEGGLPLIVYQTTGKINKSLIRYSKLMIESAAKK